MPRRSPFRLSVICCWWLAWAFACQRPPASSTASSTATIVQSGVLTCFPSGVKNPDGSLVYCEPSAVIYDGTSLIFGSDKPLPGDTLSPIFTVQWPSPGNFPQSPVRYLTYPPFQRATKYEDFTQTPDGKYLLATTGFDRVKESSSDFDGFNTLLCWKKGEPQSVQVVSPTERNGVVSSVGLRGKLARVLASPQFPQGPPYFKIEGLACLPGNQLLFGVREVGETYEKFAYTIRLVRVGYRVDKGTLTLADDFAQVYTYHPDLAELNGETVGLSGLAYDPFHDRLYVLTSYEKAATVDGIGAFLWTLPLKALAAQLPLTLVRNAAGKPLRLGHKAEGIAVLSKDRLFLVHDDDRVLGTEGLYKDGELFYRQPNQAAYTLLQINEP